MGIDSKSRANANIQGDASKRSEWMYPQMQGKVLVVNLPRMVVYLFGIMKPFLSPSMVAKVSLITVKPSTSFHKSTEVRSPLNCCQINICCIASFSSFMYGSVLSLRVVESREAESLLK